MLNADPHSLAPDAPNGAQISLVVPTFHRADLLKILLASLRAQTVNEERFEVVVVDNASPADEATADLCRGEADRGLNLSYVSHPIPGTSEARNCGIARARGNWIGFLDDDIRLPEAWLEKVIATIQSGQMEVFGGPYRPYYTQAKPAWFRDEYAILAMGKQAGWLGSKQYLLGGNMVWERGLVEALGGFSTRLGPIGYRYEYGEETEFQLRAVQRGVRLWYDPELYVYHHSPSKRMNLGWMVESRWLHGKAKARIFREDFAGSDPRPEYRIRASWARSALADLARIAGLLVRLPLRDRSRYPAYQNFVVEEILPQISGLSTAYHVARIYRKKEK
ncbi:MAG TPA: glycosyltransferase family 2 protein [Anaerolineaceae bacterium]|nr:glycosyltransferase family 2 protein [Anaerolineaceae bacterium]